MDIKRRVTVEIDLGALVRNYRRIKAHVKPMKVLCVLKANAYGLGVGPYAEALYAAGCRDFGVAEPYEALELISVLRRGKSAVFRSRIFIFRRYRANRVRRHCGRGGGVTLRHCRNLRYRRVGTVPPLFGHKTLNSFARNAASIGQQILARLTSEKVLTGVPGHFERMALVGVRAPQAMR